GVDATVARPPTVGSVELLVDLPAVDASHETLEVAFSVEPDLRLLDDRTNTTGCEVERRLTREVRLGPHVDHLAVADCGESLRVQRRLPGTPGPDAHGDGDRGGNCRSHGQPDQPSMTGRRLGGRDCVGDS